MNFDLHIYKNRDGRPMASATLGRGKTRAIEITRPLYAVLRTVHSLIHAHHQAAQFIGVLRKPRQQ